MALTCPLSELVESLQATAVPLWLHTYVRENRNAIAVDLKLFGWHKIPTPEGGAITVYREDCAPEAAIYTMSHAVNESLTRAATPDPVKPIKRHRIMEWLKARLKQETKEYHDGCRWHSSID